MKKNESNQSFGQFIGKKNQIIKNVQIIEPCKIKIRNENKVKKYIEWKKIKIIQYVLK